MPSWFPQCMKRKDNSKEKKRKANKRGKKENDRWEQILEGKVRRWLVSSRQTDPVFNLRECGVHFQTVSLKSVVLRSTLPSSELVKDGGIRTQQGKCKKHLSPQQWQMRHNQILLFNSYFCGMSHLTAKVKTVLSVKNMVNLLMNICKVWQL